MESNKISSENTHSTRPDFQFSYVIPAHPGFYVISVQPGRRDFPAAVFRLPIIAWAIEVGSYWPYPITPSGVETNYLPYECPSGPVVESAGNAFSANVKEWLTEQQERYARARNMGPEALVALRRQVEIDHAGPAEQSK